MAYTKQHQQMIFDYIQKLKVRLSETDLGPDFQPPIGPAFMVSEAAYEMMALADENRQLAKERDEARELANLIGGMN
jgi:hypothetical protein